MNLPAEKLVLLTDTPGILRDRADDATLLRTLDAEGCRALHGNTHVAGPYALQVGIAPRSLRGPVRLR